MFQNIRASSFLQGERMDWIGWNGCGVVGGVVGERARVWSGGGVRWQGVRGACGVCVCDFCVWEEVLMLERRPAAKE